MCGTRARGSCARKRMRKTDVFQQGTKVGVSFSGRQGMHQSGPTCRPHRCMALQPVARPHWLLRLWCTVGDQLSKGANQAQKVLLCAHPLLDQGFKHVLPEMLPLHLLKASARMQPAQTLKRAWHNLPHSTKGKNSKMRGKIPKDFKVGVFFACFCI